MAKKGLPVASKKPIPVKIVNEPASIDKDDARERRWRAESDLRTMKDAAEIQRDKGRMKEMKRVAKEQMNDLKKIC